MPPYEIHEIPLHNFAKRVNKMLVRLSVDDDDDVTVDVHTNLAIRDETTATVVIPDFHLDIRSRNHSGRRLTPLWAGEIGFSSSIALMKHQLSSVASMAKDLDFAFIISIRETEHPFPPISHPLHSRPELTRSAFEPRSPPSPDKFAPIFVEDVCWVGKINSITFHCFLRGANGEFDFSGNGPLCATGVCLLFIAPRHCHLWLLCRHYSPTYK